MGRIALWEVQQEIGAIEIALRHMLPLAVDLRKQHRMMYSTKDLVVMSILAALFLQGC